MSWRYAGCNSRCPTQLHKILSQTSFTWKDMQRLTEHKIDNILKEIQVNNKHAGSSSHFLIINDEMLQLHKNRADWPLR